jgi:hypothetical protein
MTPMQKRLQKPVQKWNEDVNGSLMGLYLYQNSTILAFGRKMAPMQKSMLVKSSIQ